MSQAEQGQPQIAAVVDISAAIAGALLCARGEENYTGAEHHRKKTAHLAFDENAEQRPTQKIPAGCSARDRGIVAGRQMQTENQDVGGKNPQQREAAQCVERVEALGLRDWSDRRRTPSFRLFREG